MLWLAGLAGCATEPPEPGLPDWDFERDELKQPPSESAAIGALLGSTLGKFGVAGAVAGSALQDGIALSPSDLNRVIASALAPRSGGGAKPATALALVPTDAGPAGPRWTIAESNEGQVTTDWQPIAGKTAGVLWWQKSYESEVRHVITIKPSIRAPRLTNFSIDTQVRERPNANYPWAPADPELGRASFESIKNLLLVSVRAELDRRRARK